MAMNKGTPMKSMLSPVLLVSLIFTSACAEETVYALEQGQQSSVARVIGDASVTECPNGGVVLGYGVDENGDGELETDEIDGTTIICNGSMVTMARTVWMVAMPWLTVSQFRPWK